MKFKNGVMFLFIFHIAAHKEHVRNSNSFLTSEIDSFLYVTHIYIFLKCIYSYPLQNKILLCAVKQTSLIRS